MEGAIDQSAGAYGWRAYEKRREACLQSGGQATEARQGGIEGDLVQERMGGTLVPESVRASRPFDRLKQGAGGGVAGERTHGDREPVLAVRCREWNITGTRGKVLLQQWLGTVLLYGEPQSAPTKRAA